MGTLLWMKVAFLTPTVNIISQCSAPNEPLIKNNLTLTLSQADEGHSNLINPVTDHVTITYKIEVLHYYYRESVHGRLEGDM